MFKKLVNNLHKKETYMCFMIQQTTEKKVGAWKWDDGDIEKLHDNACRRKVWSNVQRVNAD
jgi:hypothetical protein